MYQKTAKKGILIDDMEIAERWPDDAERFIAALDVDRETQKNQAMWNGKRYRPAVEAKIKQLRG